MLRPLILHLQRLRLVRDRHYFNLEDDVMQEIIDGGAVSDVEVFKPDLAPVCSATEPGDDDESPVAPVVANRRRK